MKYFNDSIRINGRSEQAMRSLFRWVQVHAMVWVAMVCGAGMIGCSNSSEPDVPVVFIQVNDSMVTVEAYLREVDEVAADILATEDADNEVKAKIRLRVLNQLTEQLIVFERAKELGIDVNDHELDARIASIKADYPKGEFEQVLLEQAVSFAEWKNDMRTRLLMQKVIDHELEPKIQVSSAEISAYYEQHFASSATQPDQEADTKSLENIILQQVRNKKKEALYRDWLENLKRRYNVHVNQAVWDQIMARQ